MKRTLAIGLILLVGAATANAGTIAFWSFDDSTNLGGTSGLWRINPLGVVGAETDYGRDIGASASAKLSTWGGTAQDGNLTGTNGTSGSSAADNFGSFGGTTLNDIRTTPSSSGSLSIVGTANNSRYFLLVFDEAWPTVDLSYATRGTSTGYDTHEVQYSTNGGASWTSLGTHAANKTSTWSVHTSSFGSAFASTSGPQVNMIKIIVTGATGTTGNNRFDNILLTPEPATMALLGLGGLAVFRRRR